MEHRLAVVAYPEFSSADYAWIDNVRQDADPRHAIIPPHFTLVYPTSALSSDDMVRHAEQRVAGRNQISFTLRNVSINHDSPDGRTYVLLVPNEGCEAITELHDSLYTGILEPELRADLPSPPHITVGSFAESKSATQLGNELKQGGIKIEGKVNQIDVVEISESRTNTIHTITLSPPA